MRGGLFTPPLYNPFGTPIPTGRWLGPATLILAQSTYSIVTGRTICLPIYVASRLTAVSLVIEHTTAAGTTGKLRLGLWRDDGAGYPGGLVVDTGTANEIDLTAAPAVNSVTISYVLEPGLYWAGFAAAFTGTTPVVRAGTTGNQAHHIMGVSASTITATSRFVGYAGTGGPAAWASGTALVDPYTAGQAATSSTNLPFVLLGT